ncbi:MAG TPA: hypothetical protein DF383_13975 [Deltaproteobacteria bacterium]|nr:hypothetical protein [Deltaproteobacteria bacterium]
MMSSSFSKIGVYCFAALTLGVWSYALVLAAHWHGREIPALLAIPNGEVGAFSHSSWQNSPNLTYHDRLLSLERQGESFAIRLQRGQKTWELRRSPTLLAGQAFLTVAVIPLFCSLIYGLFGLWLYRRQQDLSHPETLAAFNFCIALYLACIFDFHSSHRLTWIYLFSFCVLGFLIHRLAIQFPIPVQNSKLSKIYGSLSLALGASIALPYLWTFSKKQSSWSFWEGLLILYTIAGYLLWTGRLAWLSRRPLQAYLKGLSRYLFWGNLGAFLIPAATGLALLFWNRAFPANYAIPFTLLFPLSLALATLLAMLADSRARLLQSEKMAAVGSLLGGMSHELNNPLNLISANLDLLKDYLQFLSRIPLPAEPLYRGQIKAQEVLKESAEIAADMENGLHRSQEILQLLKKTARAEEAPRELFSVEAVLQEALKYLETRCPNIKAVLSSELPAGAALRLPRTLFLEVLMNLLANAYDALSFPAAPQAIRIVLQSGPDADLLGILDKGCGISPDLLGRIRDPFFTTKTPGNGTGLDLALVERWVRSWQGNLEIRSKPGQGTEIWIKLPH